MPFELGLAVGIALGDKNGRYEWRILEQVPHRIGQSLSDIAGYDATIHFGTVEGTLEALLDIFDRLRRPPLADLEDLQWVYRRVRRYRGTLGPNIYRPNTFGKLVLAAKAFVEQRQSM